ncbi:hypothetical protein AGMMS49587_09770 [Spirochaetia bacterium]|nr:hypothetical protein AGMMS49587_09770 [Spirochaetia bacterium]
MSMLQDKVMEQQYAECRNEDIQFDRIREALKKSGEYGWDCPICGCPLSKAEIKERVCPHCSHLFPEYKDD